MLGRLRKAPRYSPACATRCLETTPHASYTLRPDPRRHLRQHGSRVHRLRARGLQARALDVRQLRALPGLRRRLLPTGDGEFTREQFGDMMKRELGRVSRRHLANEISISGDEKFTAMIVMLKFEETYMQSQFSNMQSQASSMIWEIDHILHSVDGGLNCVECTASATGEESSPSFPMKGEGVEEETKRNKHARVGARGAQ
jgi:hypothetical protein